ncbi:MAG TPA: hypothetical protein VNJ09_08750 [Chthonomonadales bacterium]|nr:hypothetical protein [Chthonomonadales bacterium]
MNDPLKDAAIAFFGLALLQGLIAHRIERAVERDIGRSVRGGQIRAAVEPRGMFGLLVGQSYRTRVKACGFQGELLPIRLIPDGGPRATTRLLELDFREITVRGVPIRHLKAEIPFVTVDISKALFDERIVVRSAGEGRAEAVLDAAGLRIFIERKFPQFKNVQVHLSPDVAQLNAETLVLGVTTRLEAKGKVIPAEGRYLNLVDPSVSMNGKEATPEFTQNLLNRVNPIVDLETDLGIGDYIYMAEARLGPGILTIRGRATVPRATPTQGSK